MSACPKCREPPTRCKCEKPSRPNPFDAFLGGVGAAMGGGMGHAMAAAMEGQDRRRMVDALELIALSLFESIPPRRTGIPETVTGKRAAEIAGRIAMAKRPDPTISEAMAGDGSRAAPTLCATCGETEWAHLPGGLKSGHSFVASAR